MCQLLQYQLALVIATVLAMGWQLNVAWSAEPAAAASMRASIVSLTPPAPFRSYSLEMPPPDLWNLIRDLVATGIGPLLVEDLVDYKLVALSPERRVRKGILWFNNVGERTRFTLKISSPSKNAFAIFVEVEIEEFWIANGQWTRASEADTTPVLLLFGNKLTQALSPHLRSR